MPMPSESARPLRPVMLSMLWRMRMLELSSLIFLKEVKEEVSVFIIREKKKKYNAKKGLLIIIVCFFSFFLVFLFLSYSKTLRI